MWRRQNSPASPKAPRPPTTSTTPTAKSSSAAAPSRQPSLAGQELHYDTGAKKFTAQRYYPAGDATAVRTETALSWMIDDHHGTASMTVDATTQAGQDTSGGGQSGAGQSALQHRQPGTGGQIHCQRRIDGGERGRGGGIHPPGRMRDSAGETQPFGDEPMMGARSAEDEGQSTAVADDESAETDPAAGPSDGDAYAVMPVQVTDDSIAVVPDTAVWRAPGRSTRSTSIPLSGSGTRTGLLYGCALSERPNQSGECGVLSQTLMRVWGNLAPRADGPLADANSAAPGSA